MHTCTLAPHRWFNREASVASKNCRAFALATLRVVWFVCTILSCIAAAVELQAFPSVKARKQELQYCTRQAKEKIRFAISDNKETDHTATHSMPHPKIRCTLATLSGRGKHTCHTFKVELQSTKDGMTHLRC